MCQPEAETSQRLVIRRAVQSRQPASGRLAVKLPTVADKIVRGTALHEKAVTLLDDADLQRLLAEPHDDHGDSTVQVSRVRSRTTGQLMRLHEAAPAEAAAVSDSDLCANPIEAGMASRALALRHAADAVDSVGSPAIAARITDVIAIVVRQHALSAAGTRTLGREWRIIGYVTDCSEGDTLVDVARRNFENRFMASMRACVVGAQVAGIVARLHKEGHIALSLRPEHILVSGYDCGSGIADISVTLAERAHRHVRASCNNHLGDPAAGMAATCGLQHAPPAGEVVRDMGMTLLTLMLPSLKLQFWDSGSLERLRGDDYAAFAAAAIRATPTDSTAFTAIALHAVCAQPEAFEVLAMFDWVLSGVPALPTAAEVAAEFGFPLHPAMEALRGDGVERSLEERREEEREGYARMQHLLRTSRTSGRETLTPAPAVDAEWEDSPLQEVCDGMAKVKVQCLALGDFDVVVPRRISASGGDCAEAAKESEEELAGEVAGCAGVRAPVAVASGVEVPQIACRRVGWRGMGWVRGAARAVASAVSVVCRARSGAIAPAASGVALHERAVQAKREAGQLRRAADEVWDERVSGAGLNARGVLGG